ncbi:hypothetical protein EDB85DRAFT_1930728 [Lactarius pseudohatsudake]|nr:hypothetical protein EDB85DRAFT_1930728 [Lactarius pseudohatsudake]
MGEEPPDAGVPGCPGYRTRTRSFYVLIDRDGSKACAATAIVIIERDIVTTGVRQCQVLTSAVKHAWIVPYLVVMVFEAVVLALTVYKILGYYRGIPKQLRSKLFDVLWVDVMFIAALIVLGILNVGLVLQVQVPQLRAGGTQ